MFNFKNTEAASNIDDYAEMKFEWSSFVEQRGGKDDEYRGKQVSASQVFINNCVFEQNNAGNVSFDANYARATPFRINIDSKDFIIYYDNIMNFLIDDIHYEVLQKTQIK